MTLYYAIRVFEALCVFAGLVGGAAVICLFADEFVRLRDKRKDDET